MAALVSAPSNNGGAVVDLTDGVNGKSNDQSKEMERLRRLVENFKSSAAFYQGENKARQKQIQDLMEEKSRFEDRVKQLETSQFDGVYECGDDTGINDDNNEEQSEDQVQIDDCLCTTMDKGLPYGETRVQNLTDKKGFVENATATGLLGRAAPSFWTLLDSESTVDMLCNPALVRNIRAVDQSCYVYTAAESEATNLIADLPGYNRPVWFDYDGIAKILCLKNMRSYQHMTFE